MNRLAVLMSGERHQQLESAARELLARRPDFGPAWQALAVSLSNQGKDALPALETAAALLADDAGVHNNLGNALARLGRLDEAVTSYRRALALRPHFAEANDNLGHALMNLRRPQEALTHYGKALELKPDFAEAHDNFGNALQKLGRLDDAAASYGRAIELEPAFAAAHSNLGNTLLELGRYDDALAAFRRALEIDPALAEAHNNLGNALLAVGQLDHATASYRSALAIDPDCAAAHGNLGTALRLHGRTADAEASCLRALQIDPDMAAAIVVLAESRADNGRFPEAEELFKRAISIEPESPEAWAGISRLRKMTLDDIPWLEQAERIAARGLPARREVCLRYAIGKYFDDVSDFEQAFINYRRANELTKLHRPRYDPRQMTRTIDRTIESQGKHWLRNVCKAHSIRDGATESERPVFIVGMLRSGTTLTEQILASHSAVFGAGELTFWSCAIDAYLSSVQSGDAQDGVLEKLAADYLRLLRGVSADAPRVIDKMPSNFLSLGIIHAALPNARIIHMRRNPIDTCLSIYFQHFEAPVSYAMDLDHLAHYYGEYMRIMRHWRATLPENAILDVPYEGLVDDQERWTRKLLEFVGLPWEAHCLDFHQTRRAVITASKWQVRQKINRLSVERWRNYEKFATPLLRLANVAPVAQWSCE
jgi:tetratricopeptide (TPR) repeat protein